MKKFSKLNESNNTSYKSTIQLTIEVTVFAPNEGDAGEYIDSYIDTFVDDKNQPINITNYKILNIEEEI